MAEEGYYRDQPRFEQKDPLTMWAYLFVGVAAFVTLLLLLILFLMATGRTSGSTELLLPQSWWVGIVTFVLIGCVIGLFFVIVARLGAAQAGTYLSAGVEEPTEEDQLPEGVEAAVHEDETERMLDSTNPHPAADAARIDDPFGKDGRLMMSYTIPEAQPRGVYGDTYVPIGADQVLNVKTLLARTRRDQR